jgi:hypothetical protein
MNIEQLLNLLKEIKDEIYDIQTVEYKVNEYDKGRAKEYHKNNTIDYTLTISLKGKRILT